MVRSSAFKLHQDAKVVGESVGSGGKVAICGVISLQLAELRWVLPDALNG